MLSGTANLSLRDRIIDEGFFGVNYSLGDDIGVAIMVFVYKYWYNDLPKIVLDLYRGVI